MGLEKSWFGRLFSKLDNKYEWQMFSLVLVFVILLATLIYSEIESPLDYQIGDVTTHDIKSPISFDMVDEVTTEDKRQKAEVGVLVVFDYDNTVFEKITSAVYKSFRDMRSYMKDVKWPANAVAREEIYKDFFKYKSEFEKNLGVSIPDYLYEWLVSKHFSVRIENILIRNLDKWYENKITDSPERFIPTGQEYVLMSVVQKNVKGKEFTLHKSELVDIQNSDFFNIKDPKGMEYFELSDKANLLYLSRLILLPNVTLSKQETAHRRQEARNNIIPITISFKKNQTIVTSGTVINAQHLAVFDQIQAKQEAQNKEFTIAIAALLLFSILYLLYFYFIRSKQTKIQLNAKDVTVMSLVALTCLGSIKIFLFLIQSAIVAKFGDQISYQIFLLAAPMAAASMIVGLLIPVVEIILLFAFVFSLSLGLMFDLNLAYVVVALLGGLIAAINVIRCKKRNDFYWAGVYCGLVQCLIAGLFVLLTHFSDANFWKEFLFSIGAAFLSGIFSSLMAMMAVPLLESVFNYTTDIKLLELSNLNHPLLREMIIKAPGTYHHSLWVGSMVESAAEEIGANPLLGKVMSYYHDIGKMEHAAYFIENQKPGHNPHDHISPFLSRTLLIAHVKDGVEMGLHYKLGKPIIDGIIQHHGTTLIAYFYNKALDLKGEDDADISEEEFRYPGPKPQFREAALCMLADSIEAAARSLDEPTPVRLQNIVKNIIQRKFLDGQLDECNLTLKDLSKVEDAFKRILLGMYHQRIDYPKNSGGGASETVRSQKVSQK